MAGLYPGAPEASAIPFTASVTRLLTDALAESDRLGHEYVATEHVVLALARETESTGILSRLGIDSAKVRESLESIVKPGPAPLAIGAARPHTSRTRQAFALAAECAHANGHAGVGVEHLIYGLLREELNIGGQVLQLHGLTIEKAAAHVQQSGEAEGSAGSSSSTSSRSKGQAFRPWPPSLTERARKVLGFARDLSDRRGDAGVTPAHVALALLKEGQNVAIHVLKQRGVPLDDLAAELAAALPAAGTPRALSAVHGLLPADEIFVANAKREARDMDHVYCGAEHLLLALLRDREEVTARVLARFGVAYEDARENVRQILA